MDVDVLKKCAEAYGNLLDSDNMIFNFNEKHATYSIIKAEYLVNSVLDSEDIYIFIDKIKDLDKYFCRFFFQKAKEITQKGKAS